MLISMNVSLIDVNMGNVSTESQITLAFVNQV